MTEFENHLKAIFEIYNGEKIDPKSAAELHTPALLALAKKAFEKAEKTKVLRTDEYEVMLDGILSRLDVVLSRLEAELFPKIPKKK